MFRFQCCSSPWCSFKTPSPNCKRMTDHWNLGLGFFVAPRKKWRKCQFNGYMPVKEKTIVLSLLGMSLKWTSSKLMFKRTPVSVRTLPGSLQDDRFVNRILPFIHLFFFEVHVKPTQKNMKSIVFISSSKYFLKGFFCLFSSPAVSVKCIILSFPDLLLSIHNHPPIYWNSQGSKRVPGATVAGSGARNSRNDTRQRIAAVPIEDPRQPSWRKEPVIHGEVIHPRSLT